MVGKGRIKVTDRGPYIVTGSIPLLRMIIEVDDDGIPSRWREVEKYPLRQTYTLCRCGESRNKPYCDSSHIEKPFDGAETASRSPYLEDVKVYSGPELKLTDKKELCVGAGFCNRGGNIWNLTVHSDRPGFRDIAIDEAANCPSGRLVVWDKQDKAIEPAFEPSIVITEDQDGESGPLWIRGEVEIESADGHVYETRNRVTLCICGKSKRHPLCDVSHVQT